MKGHLCSWCATYGGLLADVLTGTTMAAAADKLGHTRGYAARAVRGALERGCVTQSDLDAAHTKRNGQERPKRKVPALRVVATRPEDMLDDTAAVVMEIRHTVNAWNGWAEQCRALRMELESMLPHRWAA